MGKREMPEQRSASRSVGAKLRLVAMVVCLLVFLGCAVYLVRLGLESYQVRQSSRSAVSQFVVSPDLSKEDGTSAEEEAGEAEDGEQAVTSTFTIDFASLQSASPYAVAWIQISGLDVIDYPVVQYSDNSYFLTRSWDSQSSRYGAIFVDAANAGDLSDCYTLIYGHNMKDGSMFGGLKKYVDESFYEENGGIITIYLPTETRTYQLFSIHYVSADDEGVYTIGFQHDDTFGSYLSAMAEKSLYNTGVTVSASDSVITLSTCSGNDRLVLHAKLVSSVPVS